MPIYFLIKRLRAKYLIALHATVDSKVIYCRVLTTKPLEDRKFIFLVKEIIYDFIIAQSFYIVSYFLKFSIDQNLM